MAPSDPPETDDPTTLPEDPADEADALEDDDRAVAVDEEEAEEEEEKLQLDVQVDERGACERHVTVTIPHEEIDRYFDREFSEMMPKVEVPGFRPGHAPRKLVEARFRKDVADKVKSDLLIASIAQVSEEQDLSPISEPDLDPDAVEIPDDGPMTFEFDLEVRPQFEVPQWKGLRLERPVREFTDADVDAALERLLADKHGQLVPHDGPAEPGDYITANLTFKHDDQVLSSASEEVIRLRPVLSFRDGKIDQFDKLLAGVTAGETRQCEAALTDDAPNEALRGQKVQAVFDVLEVKKLRLPDLTPELLEELGAFESEADLRDAIRDMLERRLEYHQHRRTREQVTAALTEAATWELPPELLKRQSQRELERAVMELRRAGFGEDEIRAHANELRQNSRASTARALKEHFILERIAEDEGIEEEEADYDREIALIAAQSGESSRRIRARLDKQGGMDVLRNQIVERKVLDAIFAEARFVEVPYVPETAETAAALDRAAGGGDEPAIPEAKPEGHAAKAKKAEPAEGGDEATQG
jgi:trigger factor